MENVQELNARKQLMKITQLMKKSQKRKIQLSEEGQTDETKFNNPEKNVTFKENVEMPPGEARNLQWMVNMHPSTQNIVGHTRSEDLSMKENLNWCTTEQLFK